MWTFNGTPNMTGQMLWQYADITAYDGREGVTINLTLPHSRERVTEEGMYHLFAPILGKEETSWIVVGNKKWTLDLDGFRSAFPSLPPMEWFHGKVHVEPEFDIDQQIQTQARYDDFEIFMEYEPRLRFQILKETYRRNTMRIDPPVEITDSLKRFEEDYRDPSKVAFIMMKYDKTDAHDQILNVIRDVLKQHGIVGVLAMDRDYHENLYENILTYLYGCGFGVAVFERISNDYFNPNVSLEIGYMLAFPKPICYLKDETLVALHTDIIGKLYKEFDTRNPQETIPTQLTRWLSDKGFI